MILRHVLLVSVMFSLFGCTALVPDPGLPENVTVKTGADNAPYIDKVSYQYPTTPNTQRNAEKCVEMNVDNNSVSLEGVNSYIGSSTGHIYHIDTSKVALGGQVTRYAKDGVVIANGRMPFTAKLFGLGVEKILAFKLIVDATGPQTLIEFSKLTEAHKQTGGTNEGFSPVGAWSAVQPRAVSNALYMLSQSLQRCMK